MEHVHAEPPNIFSGVGVRVVPGHGGPAGPVLGHMRACGLDPAAAAWLVGEIVFNASRADDEAFRRVVAAATSSVAASRLWCPTKVDADVPPTADFPHPFVVGPRPAGDYGLLIGNAGPAFLAAWTRDRKCYFELHLWLRYAAGDAEMLRSRFIWTLLDDARVKGVAVSGSPLIVPIDTTRGYKCLYAQQAGHAADRAE